jgi:hypothetical protein
LNGTDWSNVRTTTNFAFGTENPQSGVDDDSTATIVGTWGGNQQVVGTVVAPTTSDTIQQEVELRLLTTITSGTITGYEADYIGFTTTAADCGVTVQRWNGALNSFTSLAGGVGGSQTCLHTGDIVRAVVIGGKFTTYINDVIAATGTDSTFTTGKPGMGMYLEASSGGANTFGFSAWRASDNPIAYVQSGSNDTSSSGTTAAITNIPAATTTGDLMACMGYWNSTTLTASVADSTNGTYTAIGTPTSGAGALSAYRAQMFYKSGITGFATTVHPTLTTSGTTSDRGLACHEARGVTTLDQSPAVKAGSGATATSTATSTTTAVDEYAAGFAVFGNTGSGITSPWVERESTNFGANTTGDFEPSKEEIVQFSAPQSGSSNYLAGVATFK